MIQALLGGAQPEEARRLFSDLEQNVPVTLSGMTETQGVLLAARVADRTGKRVLLVDADLRCSSLARRYRFDFQYAEAFGLAQYLAGMCALEDAVYSTNLPNAR